MAPNDKTRIKVRHILTITVKFQKYINENKNKKKSSQ